MHQLGLTKTHESFPLPRYRDTSGLWKRWRSLKKLLQLPLSTVGEGELQQPLRMHLVEESELGGQLMGLLPFGGELGALLVVVVVRQLLARVRVPAKGPEAVQVDLVAHGGRQRVHQDAGAQALRRQLLGFPVAVGYKWGEGLYIETNLTFINFCGV